MSFFSKFWNSSKAQENSSGTQSEGGSSSELKEEKKHKEGETARETIESVVFAFVLAFLFRTFAAEAFVIPTGSMAPTLFGRHKDIHCDQCGYGFQFGASTEVNRESNVLNRRIKRATCPNCRFVNEKAFDAPPFKGDRILVNKFQYELSDPERFDVVVFKYPLDPKTNFIKRLIGLPGETIRIHHGNVYKVDESNKEIILRKKDPNKQKLIQIPVYDDTHPETALLEKGWPTRWAAVSRDAAKNERTLDGWSETDQSWETEREKNTYVLPQKTASDGKAHWLRYRHFVPNYEQWEFLDEDAPLTPKASLIGDRCGYNTDSLEGSAFFWNGELTVSGKWIIDQIGPDAMLTIELTQGFHLYRCHINPHSGEAQLVRVDVTLDLEEEIELARAKTSLKGSGEYHFRFANVDDRLCLWIDDSLIDFGSEASYVSSEVNGLLPQETDLCPIGLAMTSASGSVSDLLIERDIYYRGNRNGDEHAPVSNNMEGNLTNLSAWQNTYQNYSRTFDFTEIKIPEGEYFVLGDNSPASLDGRFWKDLKGYYWSETSTVPRSAFVGKAFAIYWPHGIPVGVEAGWAIPLSYHKKEQNGRIVSDRSYPLHYFPFYPNVGRMKRIR